MNIVTHSTGSTVLLSHHILTTGTPHITNNAHGHWHIPCAHHKPTTTHDLPTPYTNTTHQQHHTPTRQHDTNDTERIPHASTIPSVHYTGHHHKTSANITHQCSTHDITNHNSFNLHPVMRRRRHHTHSRRSTHRHTQQHNTSSVITTTSQSHHTHFHIAKPRSNAHPTAHYHMSPTNITH
jgi:hypothetical protein